MGKSKHGCGCGLASKIPLRGQMLILLVVCTVLFLVVAPVLIYVLRSDMSVSFEIDTASANIKRAMAAMQKVLDHEENVLNAYAIWTLMAYATEDLINGDMESFYEFLDEEMFDFGHWSDWTCGSLLAFYANGTETEPPRLVWSEYHMTDPDALEMDLENVSPTPSVFNSSDFIEKNIKGFKIVTDFLATEDAMFIVSCQPISFKGADWIYGSVCRATDIRFSLESISSGAGACISLYNMADKDMPPEYREEFDKLDPGERTENNNFKGDSFVGVANKDWKPPKYPVRMCGPAEKLKADVTPRSLTFFHLKNYPGAGTNVPGRENGFGFVLDNNREIEPMVDYVFVTTLVILVTFGLTVFIAYGLFAEFGVIRKLNLIAEAAYEALVEGEEEEYDDYFGKNSSTRGRSSSKTSSNRGKNSSYHGDKIPRKERGKNELIGMATVAAQALQKNRAELEKKQNLLRIEKLQNSLVADQLRLLALYCTRNENDLSHLLKGRRGKRKTRVKTNPSENVTTFFSKSSIIDMGAITLDRVLGDPFAIEIFKNFTVVDPETRVVRHPARKALLFLLSTLYYRSMCDAASNDARIECLKGIIEDFFGINASIGVGAVLKKREGRRQGDSLGISDAARTTLLANAAKCISSRRGSKTLFDETSTAVRDHLNKEIFPIFMKTYAFTLVRIMLEQKNVLHDKAEEVETQFDEEKSDSEARQDLEQIAAEMREMDNNTDGTRLSRSAFKFFVEV